MRLLALDAALGACSVALLADDVCLGVRLGQDSRAATASLPALVQDLLAQHGTRFDAVAVTVGPGSFTGLRGAISLARGLALGAGVPVVGVTVAEAFLAAGPPTDRIAWVALDSRRAGRIFLATGDGIVAASLSALPAPAGPVALYGDAASLAVAALREAGGDAVGIGGCGVDVVAVGRVGARRLAGALGPCDAQPLYVEPPQARQAAPLRPAPA